MIHATCCLERFSVLLTREWDSWDPHYWYTAAAKWKLFESDDREEYQLVATWPPLNHFRLWQHVKRCTGLFCFVFFKWKPEMLQQNAQFYQAVFSLIHFYCLCAELSTLVIEKGKLFSSSPGCNSRPFTTTDETSSCWMGITWHELKFLFDNLKNMTG